MYFQGLNIFTLEIILACFKKRIIKVFKIKRRIDIIMTSNISNSPRYNMISKQLNLSDFNFKNPHKNSFIKIFKTTNKLLKFIENTFQYAKITLNKYSNDYSKHQYTQHALFTILSIKIYTKSTYRETIEFIELFDKIKRYLKIKKIPHFTTIQKFFKRLPSKKLKEINTLILSQK